jgi:hypothetical protein
MQAAVRRNIVAHFLIHLGKPIKTGQANQNEHPQIETYLTNQGLDPFQRSKNIALPLNCPNIATLWMT